MYKLLFILFILCSIGCQQVLSQKTFEKLTKFPDPVNPPASEERYFTMTNGTKEDEYLQNYSKTKWWIKITFLKIKY